MSGQGQAADRKWEFREFDMAKKMTLDLTGVVSPMDLLKCNACLTAMAPGDILEVTLADVEVVENLTMIILRSNDEILYRQQTPDRICVGIRKGPRRYEDHQLQT
jgi:TusA-related sulfurtransferase